MSRTVNDWGSLVLSELDGHEAPGTVARLIAEATGKVTADVDDVVSVLLRLAEKLASIFCWPLPLVSLPLSPATIWQHRWPDQVMQPA